MKCASVMTDTLAIVPTRDNKFSRFFPVKRFYVYLVKIKFIRVYGKTAGNLEELKEENNETNLPDFNTFTIN